MGSGAGLSQEQAEPWAASHWPFLRPVDTAVTPSVPPATYAEGAALPISQMTKQRLGKVR